MNIVRFTLVALVLSLPRLAWSIDLGAAKDNTIFQDQQNNSNGKGQVIFAGNNNNKSPRHGLIQFDVANGVPAGVTITKATLTLTLANAPLPATAATIDLRPLSADWGEGSANAGSPSGMGQPAGPGDATWLANKLGTSTWASPGGDFGGISASVSVSGPVGTAYSWSSTAYPAMLTDVINWYNNPGSNYGWALVNESEGVNDQQTVKGFSSLEATSSSARPVLSIEYVPEPATLSLSLLASPLWLMRHRRRDTDGK